MTTITIGSPASYTRNVQRTAHDFLAALLGLNGRTKRRIRTRTPNPACSMASAYADVLSYKYQCGIKASASQTAPDHGSALMPEL
ncbi:hypothetical protein RY831_26420 [Noviherbaspirillum sp. CPCC 100848]|uniref:Uncharacterized protein n=1 Tax=Noviherbaspirillum album TaxID=3080276 RepID=A0ABU6JGV3_9BURK|nr:hypothetical protein [Noviherbaspirillum sp. CPCC 100848]MEC4722706.1 hypothetical protein [Noviherbaspirillum sp. CPCC 100848]